MTDLTSPAIGSTDWGTDVNDNWDALESALSMLESSFISGLGMRYVSSTQVKVLSGGARDAGGSGNIALASPATANITTGANPTGGLAQLNGLDEIDLELAHGITCTVAGSTITASSDVSGHLGTRLGSGQITTSGTAVAGTGTDLLAELAIGDLIGNATNGWARVTKISSNSSLTLAVALPGGNITTAANFSVLENATVKPEGGTKQRVNSLSGAGTAIVVASAPGGSGGALLAGV